MKHSDITQRIIGCAMREKMGKYKREKTARGQSSLIKESGGKPLVMVLLKLLYAGF